MHNSKQTLQNMVKRKRDKDEIGNILLKQFLPVYNLAQKVAEAGHFVPSWIHLFNSMMFLEHCYLYQNELGCFYILLCCLSYLMQMIKEISSMVPKVSQVFKITLYIVF